MNLITRALILPLAHLSLGIAVIQSLVSPWACSAAGGSRRNWPLTSWWWPSYWRNCRASTLWPAPRRRLRPSLTFRRQGVLRRSRRRRSAGADDHAAVVGVQTARPDPLWLAESDRGARAWGVVTSSRFCGRPASPDRPSPPRQSADLGSLPSALINKVDGNPVRARLVWASIVPSTQTPRCCTETLAKTSGQPERPCHRRTRPRPRSLARPCRPARRPRMAFP